MRIERFSYVTLSLLSSLALLGCPASVAEDCDDGEDNDGDGSTDCVDTDCAADAACAGDDDDSTADDDDSTADDDDSTAGDDDSTGDDDDSTKGGDYVFRTDAPELYAARDRMGMPAVATALIASGNKDNYNAGSPASDVAGDFVTDIVGSLAYIHHGTGNAGEFPGLDPALASLGLTPCTETGDGSGSCTAQGGPLVLPDTLKINTMEPAGFPNGRKLADPVVDVTLAVLLLDLSAHPVTFFIDLDGDPGTPGPSLNPLANDLEFGTSFPYLAPAHP